MLAGPIFSREALTSPRQFKHYLIRSGYVAASVVNPGQELGAAYDAAMREKVFGPLGMSRTTFDFAKAMSGNFASPHRDDVGGRTTLAGMDLNYSVVPVRPTGGMWTSARDLAKYLQMELAPATEPQLVKVDAAQLRKALTYLIRYLTHNSPSDLAKISLSVGHHSAGEGAQDVADKAASSYTKEFLFSLSNNERDVLQLVEEALTRVGSDNFGVCVVCEDEMDRKRLEAVPWAKRCLSCQEKQEQGLL